LVRKLPFVVGVVSGYWAVKRSRPAFELKDKTVFITGGSRGLGFLLALEFAKAGSRVAICARDPEEIKRAEKLLADAGVSVFGIDCDVTLREEAEIAVQKVQEQLGPIDVLVNNAGVITVGPMESMTIDDYRDSINTHFWGPFFTITAALRTMRSRRHGRIVNISSIGGKISVPHLLPYSVGKFALTGFSEGLHSELRKDNIIVTTVCPGLMRTGSPRNASFKGDNQAEYAWFSISDSIPLLSMSARRAAQQIVKACQRGDAEVTLSLPAKVATKIHGLFPGTTAEAMALSNRFLPSANGNKQARTGAQSASEISPSWLTTLTERAASENNEVA